MRLIPPVVEGGSLGGSPQPVVAVGDGLALRPWAAHDAPAVIRAFTDPDIQHWHFRRYETVAEAQVWISSEVEGWYSERAASWAIVRTESDTVLGRVAIYPNLQDGYGEVTYWVLREARGQRIATRATRRRDKVGPRPRIASSPARALNSQRRRICYASIGSIVTTSRAS